MKRIRKDLDYYIIDLEDLDQIIEEIKAVGGFEFDLETTSLKTDEAEICGVVFSYRDNEGFYLPIKSPEESIAWAEASEKLAPLFKDDKVEKWTHNGIAYDAQVLFHNGIHCKGLSDDTIIAHHFLFSDTFPKDLDALSLHYFNYIKVTTDSLIGKGKKKITFDKVPLETAAFYGVEDAVFQYKLRIAILNEIKERKQYESYCTYLRPLGQVLFDMYANGFAIDKEKMEAFDQFLTKKMDQLKKRIAKLGKWKAFNPNSFKQKSRLLYEDLKLHKKYPKIRIPRTGAGKMATNESVLTKFPKKEKIPHLLVEYSKYQKLEGTYTKGYLKRVFEENGSYILRTTLRPLASTFRLQSRNPNLQNIPRPGDDGEADQTIRTFFIPRKKGYKIVGADISQAELRVASHYSGDEVMVKSFENDGDIHADVAKKVFKTDTPTKEQRVKAKTLNFGCVPLDTEALTLDGWKAYHQIDKGDMVLGYKDGKLVWTPVIDKVYYPEAPTVTIYNSYWSATTTENHRWLSSRRSDSQKVVFTETRNVTCNDSLILSAPVKCKDTSGLSPSDAAKILWHRADFNSKPLSDVVRRFGPEQRKAFLRATSLEGGHFNKNDEIAEAIKLAIFMDGNHIGSSINRDRGSRVTGRRLKTRDAGRQPVWCIKTDCNTWVMRQGQQIMLTGNTLYGAGPYKNSLTLKCSVEEAEKFNQEYFQSMPGLKDYLDAAKDFAKCYGYVENLYGGRRWLPNIYSIVPSKKAAAEREATNFYIQSTVAFIIAACMIESANMIVESNFDARFVLQVHDELIFEVKNEDVEQFSVELQKIMTKSRGLSVPIKSDVESGNNMLEAH